MDIYKKAQTLGILTEFIDGQGERRRTDEVTLRIIIEALPAQTERRLVAGPLVIRSGAPARTTFADAARLPVRWTIDAGGGDSIAQGMGYRSLDWPAAGWPLGT